MHCLLCFFVSYTVDVIGFSLYMFFLLILLIVNLFEFHLCFSPLKNYVLIILKSWLDFYCDIS